jgi:uncharacterized protein (DUF433 family)
MNKKGNRTKKRTTGKITLGEHIIADPEICHGKPVIKGTRIMVWQILEELEQEKSPDEIIAAWGGKISRAAIAESVRLARESLLDKNGRLLNPDALAAA